MLDVVVYVLNKIRGESLSTGQGLSGALVLVAHLRGGHTSGAVVEEGEEGAISMRTRIKIDGKGRRSRTEIQSWKLIDSGVRWEKCSGPCYVPRRRAC